MKVRRIATVLALVLTGAFCLTQLAEVDFFWHLLTGRVILEEGRVPRIDTFTFTSAGRSWIDMHWLFQAGAAAAHRTAGWPGLDGLKVTLIVAGFGAALAAGLRRRGTAVAPALLLLGAVAAQERFTLRPEAASFCLLGLLLLILEQRDGSPRLLWLVPPLIALWANLHALYVVGLATLGLVLCGDACDRFRKPPISNRPERSFTRSLPVAATALLASLFTPYGWAGWSLPRTLFLERIATDNLYGRTIAEFQAPFSGYGRTASVAAFAVLALLVVTGVAWSWRSRRSADLLLLAAFLGLALLARRNMPLFAMVAVSAGSPAVAAALDRWLAAIDRRVGPGSRPSARSDGVLAVIVSGVAVLLLLDVVSNRFYARDGTQRYIGVGVAPGYYPEAAAGMVKTWNPPGGTLNDMTMGGYLAWRWYPEKRIYIDGRLEVHSAELYGTYVSLQQDVHRFEREATRLGLDSVIWSHRHALDAAPLLRYLASGHGWRLVHVDLAASVFAREPTEFPGASASLPDAVVPDAARLLLEAAAAEVQTTADDPLPAWLRSLVPRVEVPTAEVGAALFCVVIGYPEAGERLLRDAVRRAPWSPELHYDHGLALSQLNRDQEARAAFLEALRLDSGMTHAAVALALLKLRAGDEEGALRDLERAGRRDSLPARALQARGQLLARRGRVDEAIADLRAALDQEPAQSTWRAELALLLAERGSNDQAQVEIERAVRGDPESCPVKVAAARLRSARGQQGEAEALLRAALERDATCVDAVLDLARLLVRTGRAAEAREALGEALRRGLDPGTIAADPVLGALLPGS